jgi:AraC-like DNA-binding protein
MPKTTNTAPDWPSADVLGEALHFLRVDGVFYSQCEFSGRWGLLLPALENTLMFHVVTSGTCQLQAPDMSTCTLRAGDFVLLPHGHGHALLSQKGVAAVALFDLPRQQISERFDLIRLGLAEPNTRMVCGAVRFDHPAGRRLVSLLPSLIHLDSLNTQSNWISDVLRLMANEVKALRPGGEAIVTRLADILVIQAIRNWIASEAQGRTGWLHALRDRQIGRALMLIHKQPEHPWTLNALAAKVAMSRAAFAARFTSLAGEPAMHYVTRWRMNTAHSMLTELNVSVSELSLKLGYQSEAAFNRAFKRIHGVTPGSVKRKMT